MFGGRDFIKGMYNFDFDNMDYWNFLNLIVFLLVNLFFYNLKRMVFVLMF